MKMKKPHRLRVIRLWHYLPVVIVLAVVGIVYGATVIRENINLGKSVQWGVTFSTKYAKELGLDWKQVYISALDELGIRRLRIPVYWDEVQPKPGAFDFRDVDWMLAEAEKRDVRVLLVLGRRVPRWPECHTPRWASIDGLKKENEYVLALVKAEVQHFKNKKAIAAWQVENEPLLDAFGVCPPGDMNLLGEERRLVKSLDPTRRVVITDSGELSFWLRTGLYADVLGISMYRVTWNKWLGYFFYPITPAYYQNKAAALYPFVRKVIVSELQAEPWPSRNRSIPDTPIPEQYDSMNVLRMKNNIEFAHRVGFSEVYLWGVEWWYWIREKGDPSFWNLGRELYMNGPRNLK